MEPTVAPLLWTIIPSSSCDASKGNILDAFVSTVVGVRISSMHKGAPFMNLSKVLDDGGPERRVLFDQPHPVAKIHLVVFDGLAEDKGNCLNSTE